MIHDQYNNQWLSKLSLGDSQFNAIDALDDGDGSMVNLSNKTTVNDVDINIRVGPSIDDLRP